MYRLFAFQPLCQRFLQFLHTVVYTLQHAQGAFIIAGSRFVYSGFVFPLPCRWTGGYEICVRRYMAGA